MGKIDKNNILKSLEILDYKIKSNDKIQNDYKAVIEFLNSNETSKLEQKNILKNFYNICIEISNYEEIERLYQENKKENRHQNDYKGEFEALIDIEELALEYYCKYATYNECIVFEKIKKTYEFFQKMKCTSKKFNKDKIMEALNRLSSESDIINIDIELVKFLKEECSTLYDIKINFKKLFEIYIKISNYETIKALNNKGLLKYVLELKPCAIEYLNEYGIYSEKVEYDKIKDNHRIFIQMEKQKQIFKENFLKYDYVQSILKLLVYKEEVIFDYYYKKGIKPNALKSSLKRYENISDASEKELNAIQEKISKYEEFCRQKANQRQHELRKNERNLNIEKLKILMEDIVNSKMSFAVYCETNGIDNRETRRQLYRLKINDEKLYEMYMANIRKNTTIESKNNVSISYMMQSNIKNGINENNITREFDIIDYYTMTKISPSLFISSIRKTIKSESDILDLLIFLQNANEKIRMNFDIDEELASDYSVTICDDERMITKNEKQMLVNCLKHNSIPINYLTYSAIMNRYVEKLKTEIKTM